jgi:predicted amidohydrolase YtcJ
MKTVLHNGKIYIERGVFCEALLIEDGYIRAAGTNDEVFDAATKPSAEMLDAQHAAEQGRQVSEDHDAEPVGGVRFINCKGRTVVPGFNDTHMHLLQFSEFIAGVRTEDATSIDMIVERCREFIAENPDRVKNGVHAMGWNQDLFTDEKRMLNRHDLDRISTEIPVVLERVCGHIASGNTKAIELLLAQSGGTVPAVEDGEIELEEDGYPNGIFKEGAVNTIADIIPKYTPEEWYDLVIEGMRYAASKGYTSIQSTDLGFSGIKEEDVFRIMKDVRASGRMAVRYRHQCAYFTLDAFEESLKNGEYAAADEEYDMDGGMLTMGPLKLFADGSLGARTALLGRDYADDPGNRGLVWIPLEEMHAYVKMANEHGVQVITHAIGDQAVRNVLDAYEAADPTGTNPCRNVINHVQITDRECLDRIRDGNILTAVQPIFLEYDIHMAEDRVGPELAATSYAFNTMYKEGVHQSFGTDAPVEDLAPLPNVYTAVTRKDLKGEPAEGWYPNECMDIYDAVDCATIEGAYMEFAEDVKGRLKPGYLADLVILDKDIFTCPADEIKDALPVITMLGGEIVYERQ